MTRKKVTTDPRVKRTRQLIIDAFLNLISKKDFKDITVKDITSEATINRATFYAHFQDKYELFDYTIASRFNEILEEKVDVEAEMDENFIKNLMISVCEYHKVVSEACNKGYMSVVQHMDEKSKQIIREILIPKLNNDGRKKRDALEVNLLAVMISNCITGVAYEWNNTESTRSSEEVAKKVLPFILSGIQSM